MSVELPKLPFSFGALEPYISKRTLEFHYGKHHRNYVDTLNHLIAGTSLDRLDLDEILRKTFQVKPKIYNNAAQAWNHAFFWNCLARSKKGPSRILKQAIEKEFQTLAGFKEEFSQAGKDLFGSGWVWLVKDRKGRLKIRALPDAENPMTKGDVPILTCDVWEHAYYLDYQNERPKYLEGFWSIVNWEFVERGLERAFAKPFRRRVQTSHLATTKTQSERYYN